jgi:putative hydrolase
VFYLNNYLRSKLARTPKKGRIEKMSPFGFTPPGNGSDDGSYDGSADNNGPEDFNEMLRAIQEQMRAQFEKLGIPVEGMDNLQEMTPENLSALFSGLAGVGGFAGFGPSGNTPADPLPINTVRETAKKFITAQGVVPLSTRDQSVVASAYEISEIWLNEATSFPSALSPASASAVNRTDWIDLTISGWHRDIAPLAQGLLEAMADLLSQATQEQVAQEQGAENPMPLEAIGGLLRGFIAAMVATQLGQSIGSLASTVTGAHDAGLPILDPPRPVLIPENIAAWSADLEIPQSEVYLFHALREGAVARLFAHNPWLVSYIQSTITEYGRGIRIDLEAIQRQAEEAMSGFDPSQPIEGQVNLSIELNNGIFSPEESPQQKAALEKLETVLALIDGWTDDVVTTAAGDRMPNIEALRETQRRRRAASTPAQQLFATLLGLEVSPRLTREASAFWRTIREESQIESRDALWAGILPTADDLKNPSGFIASTTVPDDLSGLL